MLLPGTWVKTESTRILHTYFSLVGVAEENARLREEAAQTERYLASIREDLAELARLRDLMGISPPEAWNTLGTRILAGRFGPGAALDTIMIDRGFASGAAVGTPLITGQGLVGRVFRASPHIATVLLVTDQTFRVPVLTGEGRVPGLLVGNGPSAKLEVRYIAPNAQVRPGELLITSGLDDSFPKGVPVGRVLSVEPGAQTLFQQVQAEPLVSSDALEEALLLIAPENWPLNAAMPDVLPRALRSPGPLPPPPPSGEVTARPGEPVPPANRRPPARLAPPAASRQAGQ